MSAPLQQSMSPYAGLFGSPPRAAVSDFQAKKRLKLYHWASKTGESSKGLILLVHGFGEHLGRYDHVAEFYASLGYEVRGSDLVAHGLSEGFDGSYGRLDIEELTANWTQYVWSEIMPLSGPHYIYCHSTGGLITFLALERLAEKWPQLRGVVFSAPLIRRHMNSCDICDEI